DRRTYVDLLTSTIFPAPAYKTYGGLIADGKFLPAAFTVPLGYKDVRLALAAAETLQVPMPLGSLLHDRFLRLLAQGGERLGYAAQPRAHRVGDVESRMIQRRRECLCIPGDIHEPDLQRGRNRNTRADQQYGNRGHPRVVRSEAEQAQCDGVPGQ